LDRIDVTRLRRRTKPWKGMEINLSDGNVIEIDTALVDEDDKPKFFYVKTGWFGTEIAGKEVLMPASIVEMEDDEYRAELDKETIEKFPEWDDESPITQTLIDEVSKREDEIVGNNYNKSENEKKDREDE
jgi:hypothetical protein